MKVAAVIIVILFGAATVLCAVVLVSNCAELWNTPESARTLSQDFSLMWPLVVGAMTGIFTWMGVQMYREQP